LPPAKGEGEGIKKRGKLLSDAIVKVRGFYSQIAEDNMGFL